MLVVKVLEASIDDWILAPTTGETGAETCVKNSTNATAGSRRRNSGQLIERQGMAPVVEVLEMSHRSKAMGSQARTARDVE